MTGDPVRRFEVMVLKPIYFAFIGAGLTTLLNGRWLWLIGCVGGLFYLGVIGSRLHPLQSASDLAKGPTTGSAAIAEAAVLPERVKSLLVQKACTSVGIFIGFTVLFLLIGAAGWRWYWAVLVLWPAIAVPAGALRAFFDHNDSK